MPLTLAQLVNAGFPSENFPPELPEPSPDTIKLYDLGNKNELYRYEASVGGQAFAMEVVVDRKTLEDPSEGVCFMLNQFAYLWRRDKAQITVQADNSCRRINF